MEVEKVGFAAILEQNRAGVAGGGRLTGNAR